MQDNLQSLKELEKSHFTNGYTFSEKTHKMYDSFTNEDKIKLNDFLFELVTVSRADGFDGGTQDALHSRNGVTDSL